MIQGVIGRVFEKQFGNKRFYSFSVNGTDGFFGTGVKRPPNPGTSVKFNEKTNAKGYLEVDGSIEMLSDSAAAPTPSIGTLSKAASAGAGGGAAYWDRKEARDFVNDAARELGASRNTAISIIDLALKYEVIKLPAAAKREEFLWALLDRYVNKLMGKEGDGNREENDRETSAENRSNKSGSEVSVGERIENNDDWS